MSENKISQEQLDVVKPLVAAIRELEGNFFKASIQAEELNQVKAQLLATMQQKNQELQAEMAKLKETYGDIIVNLEDGSYQDAPVQEAQVVEE
jgi:predicted unusual protein kinase regulating ubiquinone biosynthesis (AarF/ABC1/UbiB family)